MNNVSRMDVVNGLHNLVKDELDMSTSFIEFLKID